MSLLVIGSLALDTIETPFGKAERTLGGSATFISTSASYFTESVRLVGIVGYDFPESEVEFLKSKNKIGFLTNQFNTLLNQVEINRKTFEEQVCVKTKEIENKLYYDELTNLKNRYALEEETKENDFVSITLIDIDCISFCNII